MPECSSTGSLGPGRVQYRTAHDWKGWAKCCREQTRPRDLARDSSGRTIRTSPLLHRRAYRLEPRAGLGLGLFQPLIVARIATERLAVVGDGGVAVAFQFVRAAAGVPGANAVKSERDHLVEVGEGFLDPPEREADLAAGVEDVAIVWRQRDSLVGVGEACLRLCPLEPFPLNKNVLDLFLSFSDM